MLLPFVELWHLPKPIPYQLSLCSTMLRCIKLNDYPNLFFYSCTNETSAKRSRVKWPTHFILAFPLISTPVTARYPTPLCITTINVAILDAHLNVNLFTRPTRWAHNNPLLCSTSRGTMNKVSRCLIYSTMTVATSWLVETTGFSVTMTERSTFAFLSVFFPFDLFACSPSLKIV